MVSNALVGAIRATHREAGAGRVLRAVHRRRLMSLMGYWQMQRTSPMPVRSRSTSIVTDCRSRTCLRALPDQDQSLRWALRGDDYELLFTLPPDSILPRWLHEIGRVVAGSG